MQKQSSATRGFTLIELLVVIAIIGILSSVVLASLNTARQKGSDASVQTDINTIRSQAALYYSDNSTYGTAVAQTAITAAESVAATPTSFIDANQTNVNAINQAIANGGADVEYAIGPNGSTYAIAALLNSGKWACTDANGTAVTLASTKITNGGTELGGGGSPAACP